MGKSVFMVSYPVLCPLKEASSEETEEDFCPRPQMNRPQNEGTEAVAAYV